MFGDPPEAADLGRICEICRTELEIDSPWCECCTKGEESLWEKTETLKISSGERTAMSILTQWSEQLTGWNLQQGLELLIKPSNRKFPRTTNPKRAPFVVIEELTPQGKQRILRLWQRLFLNYSILFGSLLFQLISPR